MSILKAMHDGVPGRQAPLLVASGASRTAFASSLAHLVELGILERNPGHGHPLRPEFRLTEEGMRFAKMADMIAGALPDESGQSLLRRTWTLPVLAVSGRPRRFVDIKSDLSPITDRALSQSLQKLEARHWLHREIDIASHPPRPIYQAANEGIAISNAISGLL
ncbi:winged helix-turn-helix transcriptional regulator [Hoeflea prorocentri]|uniref:Winged helix-turn-helix transcriptional regulator n=1 Tax=Hoeflea prorocentri TaxID=1922333 RepID=A0A9X3ZJ60_9HYPH|nr:winged helix-turn-helix transcriptional regulator [Hoeflea prorocentri]MCY6382576.1 winged helix-turn-helix transcriptional regulator [Hoeflea prorocentri]MDA5400376.1 winged helix-turn-helix transcriptional regulator [Hoeflea prorocentri]